MHLTLCQVLTSNNYYQDCARYGFHPLSHTKACAYLYLIPSPPPSMCHMEPNNFIDIGINICFGFYVKQVNHNSATVFTCDIQISRTDFKMLTIVHMMDTLWGILKQDYSINTVGHLLALTIC